MIQRIPVLCSRDVVFNEREFGIASESRYENRCVQLECHNMEGPTDKDPEESLPRMTAEPPSEM